MSVLTSVSRILQYNSSKFHRFGKPQNLYFENYGANFFEPDTYHTVSLIESEKNIKEPNNRNFGKTVRDFFIQKYLMSRHERLIDSTQGPEILASQIDCFEFITEPFSKELLLIRRKKSVEMNESNEDVTATSYFSSLLPFISKLETSVVSKADLERLRDLVENSIFFFKEHKMNLPGTLPEGTEYDSPEACDRKPRDVRPHLAPMPKTQSPPKMPPLPSCPPRVRKKNRKSTDCPRPPLSE